MERGEKLNTDLINDGTDTEAVTGWESLMEDEDEDVEAFAVRALQKQKARERISQEERHSEPEVPYRQQRKRIEQNLGHVGTSMRDIRDKTTDRQAIQQEFRDWDVDSGDYDTMMQEYEAARNAAPEAAPEKLSFHETIEKYNGLFTFLGETTTPNPNVEFDYSMIKGQKERLQFILDASLADKVKLFCGDKFGYANYDNFMRRMQFQQDFMNGTAMVWDSEWDSDRGEYVDVQTPLDSELAEPDNIRLGLDRASLKAAMIGTPEYGAYKMALDFASDRKYYTPADFPKIKGYESGIHKNENGSSIGDWSVIIDEYQKIADGTAKRRPDLIGDDLEYRAVRDAARIFADSMEYNLTDRGPNSPYISSFHESVAWAQLGDDVKKMFRGMRQRIQGVDLHNIGRFLGRSGRSEKLMSLVQEGNWLDHKLESLKYYRKNDNGDYQDGIHHHYYNDSDEMHEMNKLRQEFLAQENEGKIRKQNAWREKETARINHKYDKLISKTRSAERNAEYEKCRTTELENVNRDVAEQITYLENRTLEQLVNDMGKRRKLLETRINKRKSIAEKAIDLHFALMPEYDYGSDDDDDDDRGKSIVPFQVNTPIDWINTAPFGMIRKAHKLLSSELPKQEIILEAYKSSVSADELSKWATNEVASGMNHYAYGYGARFDMTGASEFLRKTLGENFKYDADTSAIQRELANRLYTFLPAIERDQDSIPVPPEFFNSDMMVDGAIKHLRALTDPSLIEDGLPWQDGDADLWNGTGIAKTLLDKFILPNQPDFFHNDKNKQSILRMLRQSAFHMDNAGQFQDIVSVSEEYLPGIYDGQIEDLRAIRNKIKESKPDSDASWNEWQPYRNVVRIFSIIADYDGVDFPDPEAIINLANNGMNTEDLSRALGNGFAIEEIVRYPFLCSKLLKKANQGE